MPERKVRRETLSITSNQAGGNQEIVLSSFCDKFVVSCKSSGTGTLKFSIKIVEDGDWEYLYDQDTGTQQEIDVDSDKLSFVFEGWVYAIRIEPISISSTYSVYVQQGNM